MLTRTHKDNGKNKDYIYLDKDKNLIYKGLQVATWVLQTTGHTSATIHNAHNT